jgi:hypothetical protein
LKILRTSFVKTLLVVLYVSFYMGNTLFVHTHHFPTYSITHSHPFLPAKDGSPQHTHTPAAFVLIAQINSFVVELAPMLALLIAPASFCVVVQRCKSVVFIRLMRFNSLRAPPVCI